MASCPYLPMGFEAHAYFKLQIILFAYVPGVNMRRLSQSNSFPANCLVNVAGLKSTRDNTTRAVAAVCMLAVSPTTLALAQSANSGQQLPPIVVEGQKAKKKPVASKKSTTPKKVKQAAPTPQPPSAEPSEPLAASGEGSTAPGGNPYANPDAPYNVQRSASGKFTEPLANTPKSVTTIPKEVIQDKGARDLRELARETPGLSIGAAEGGNSFGAFYLRGFKVSNDIFIDGIRNPGNVIPDAFSVEQIEIYKGPSGGIAGRGTIGGAINLISKQPDLNMSHYEIGTTVGTDETIRTTLDANQVITKDFAVRANLMYDQHDIAGRDFTDSERWGGLISATARASDSLKITLDYYRYRNDATPDWGVPINPATRVPFTENGLSRDTWFGQKSLDFFKEEADVGTATIEAKLADGITLTNKTRVGTSSLAYVASSPGTLNLPAGTIGIGHPQREQIADLYANQTELNVSFNTGIWRHNMVAGLELSREEFERNSFTLNTFVGETTSFPNPDPYRNTRQIVGKARVYDATIDTIGAYLTDTVHLSDQWIVNGGIRFDDFERDQVGGPTGTNPRNTANVQDNLFSWNVGVVYKPIPIASLYAAYATAESPVGSELDATGANYNGLAANLVDVKPQEARSVEVGTKWELFNRRLLATAALFQTDVDNARTNGAVTAVDPGDPPPPNDVNAYSGEYRIRGLELSVAGNITREWSVFGGFVLLDTEVLKSSADAQQDVGRGLANIPERQFSLLSKYRLTDKLSVGGQAVYSDEVYAGHLARNASNRHTVDYWRFDAMAEYQLTDNIELEVSGINLTDELYYDAIYQGGNFAFVAPGRAGYLTVKWKY